MLSLLPWLLSDDVSKQLSARQDLKSPDFVSPSKLPNFVARNPPMKALFFWQGSRLKICKSLRRESQGEFYFLSTTLSQHSMWRFIMWLNVPCSPILRNIELTSFPNGTPVSEEGEVPEVPWLKNGGLHAGNSWPWSWSELTPHHTLQPARNAPSRLSGQPRSWLVDMFVR